jgi:hypothetical protein
VTLFTRSAREHILLLVVHHIVIDFWSLAILLDELGVLYPAEKRGAQVILPSLKVRYTDYVRWQAEMLASPEGERLWAYWQEQLAGQLPVLQPGLIGHGPRFRLIEGTHDFTMDADLSSGLKALARLVGRRCTVLLAAFQVLLSPYQPGRPAGGIPGGGQERPSSWHRRPLYEPRHLEGISPATRPSGHFLISSPHRAVCLEHQITHRSIG